MPRNRSSRATSARMRLQLSSTLPSSTRSTRTSQSVRESSDARTPSSYAVRPALSLYTGVRISTFGLRFIGDPVLEFRSEQLHQLAGGSGVAVPQSMADVVGHRVASLRGVDDVEAKRIVRSRRDTEECMETRSQIAGAQDDVIELEAEDLLARKQVEVRPQHRRVQAAREVRVRPRVAQVRRQAALARVFFGEGALETERFHAVHARPRP